MSSKNIRYKLDLIARDAAKELRDLQKAAEGIEGELEGVESAGKTMAKAITRAAEEIDNELEQTERAAKALGDALGPELSASIGQSGLNKMAADLRSAGLTAADVEADAEELAAAIRRLDESAGRLDGPNRGLLDMEDGFERVRAGSEKADDATRSFVGNAVSEMPGVADSFGPVGEAASQLTEGVLEGEVGLKSLATAGLALGAVTMVVKGVTGAMERMKEARAFDTDQVEEFVDAISEAEDAVDGLRDALADTGKIEVRGVLGGIEDITGVLADAGITLDDWTAAVAGGSAEAEGLADKLRTANVSAEDAVTVLKGLEFAQANYTAAVDTAGDRTAVFGEAAEEATEAVEDQESAVDKLTAALQDQVEQLEDSVAAQHELIDARRAAADATFALRDAEDEFTEALAAANEVINESDGDLRAIRGAMDDAAKSAGSLADAAVRVADEQATAAGRTLTAAQRLDTWNRSALDSAAAASGPLRTGILEYIAAVNGIPPERLTDIQALIDAGKLDEARAALDEASAARDAAIVADVDEAAAAAAQAELDRLTAPRYVPVIARPGAAGINAPRPYAAGGPVGPAGGIAGENWRPELLNGQLITGPTAVQAGDVVTGEASTARLLAELARPSITNVVVNMPAGTDPTGVIRAERAYRRRNGAR
jgi:hypothetical protein